MAPGALGGRERRWLAGGGAAFAVTAACQIVIPLREVGERTGLTVAVVGGLAAATFAFAAASWGWRAAAATAAAVVGLALGVEWVGVTTGWPFGRYEYTGVLRPEVAGVPAVVPLAWFAVGVPAWEVAARLAKTFTRRVALGAVALAAWDLFLDPQMVTEGFWRWPGGGAYRGIPLSNFAGWLLASAAVVAVVDRLAPRRARRSLPLFGVYAWMVVMEAVGFVFFFGDAVVGLVGAAASWPLVALAWRRSATSARGGRDRG